MITVAHSIQTVQQETISSLSHALNRVYSAAIGGPSPVPPNQMILIPFTVLTQYQSMIQELEKRTAEATAMITELLREQYVQTIHEEPVGSVTNPLNAQQIALVNSLLSTVPESSFLRDEVEEL